MFKLEKKSHDNYHFHLKLNNLLKRVCCKCSFLNCGKMYVCRSFKISKRSEINLKLLLCNPKSRHWIPKYSGHHLLIAAYFTRLEIPPHSPENSWHNGLVFRKGHIITFFKQFVRQKGKVKTCNITGTTLWLDSSSSFHFKLNYKKSKFILLHIRN